MPASQLHARIGLGPVAYEVTQAPQLLAVGRLDLVEHGLEGVPVAVYVRYDSDPHATTYFSPLGEKPSTLTRASVDAHGVCRCGSGCAMAGASRNGHRPCADRCPILLHRGGDRARKEVRPSAVHARYGPRSGRDGGAGAAGAPPPARSAPP